MKDVYITIPAVKMLAYAYPPTPRGNMTLRHQAPPIARTTTTMVSASKASPIYA